MAGYEVIIDKIAGAGRAAQRVAVQFDQGINAARADEPHRTALGHSYGSLTTGIALQQNTGVRDAVFFGSPGITDTPSWLPGSGNPVQHLQVPTGHTYDLAASGDPIANDVPILGRYGDAPQTLPSVTQLSTDAAVSPDGPLAASHGHSQYTTSINGIDTTSKYNIAAVVAGQPDLTIPARYLGRESRHSASHQRGPRRARRYRSCRYRM